MAKHMLLSCSELAGGEKKVQGLHFSTQATETRQLDGRHHLRAVEMPRGMYKWKPLPVSLKLRGEKAVKTKNSAATAAAAEASAGSTMAAAAALGSGCCYREVLRLGESAPAAGFRSLAGCWPRALKAKKRE